MEGAKHAGCGRPRNHLLAWLAATTAICSLGPATAALAQSAPGSAGATASEPVQIEDVIVTARRRDERLLDVPVAITAISAEEAQRYNVTSIQSIRLVAPQVSFDRAFTGSGTSIALRGVSSSSLDAGLEQSVLLDYDGMPLSRGRVLSDALFDIDGIDVLKGPQSLFFGKNTPGGVVSVRTAGPTSDLQGFVRAGYEFTADEPSVEAAISGPINDKVGFRLAGFASQSKGFITNDNPGIVDPFRTALLPVDTGGTFVPASQRRLGAEDKYGLRATLTYDDGGNFDATLKILGTYSKNQGLQSFSQVTGCPAGVTRPRSSGRADPYGECELNNHVSAGTLPPAVVASWPAIRDWVTGEPTGRNKSHLPTLTMNYKAGDITLTSVTGLYHYNYRSAGSADATAYNFFWSYQIEKNTSFVQEVRAVSAFEGPINFAAGGYYEHDKRTLWGGAQNGPVPLDPATGRYYTNDNRIDNMGHAWSVFGQLTFKPVDSLELAGGARYTRQTKNVAIQTLYVNPVVAAAFLVPNTPLRGRHTEDHISPEATITWHATPDVMVYAAYKSGYLSGGFSNPGTPVRSLTIPLISYDAEKADGFEGGVKATLLDRRLSGSLIGYRYVYEGLQLTSLNATLAQPAFQTTNAADTLIQGVELEGAFKATDGLTLRASINYNDAQYRDFPVAQCYAGQTAAMGCISTRVGAATVTRQDLSGADVYRSPDWVVSAGFVYEFAIGDSLKAQLNADIRKTSGYYISVTNNPVAYQGGYTLLNAGARLASLDDRWTVSVIGRNLTNEHYAVIGTDKPGGLGEVFGVAGEPRAVVLQLQSRF
jgi:iron complex outermembrane receptor protein